MERFCDDLRHEREQRQITLDTISGITKVSCRHLHALETGNYADLPGGVFRKGILRGYLSVLDLDPAPWVQRFDNLLAETGTAVSIPPEAPDQFAQFAENVRRSRPETISSHSSRWVGVLVMLLVLAALCSFVWIFALRGHVSL